MEPQLGTSLEAVAFVKNVVLGEARVGCFHDAPGIVVHARASPQGLHDH